MEMFPPDGEHSTGAAMLVFPGGAYTFISEKSGAEYGCWLASHGVTAFVVHYRLGSRGYRYDACLADAQRAFFLLRAVPDKWQIDPRRIGVIGTSAGGHLAALLLTQAGPQGSGDLAADHLERAARPALGVLCYPVVSMTDPMAHVDSRQNFLGDRHHDVALQRRLSPILAVDTDTPPCFIWHANEDEEVTPANSVCFADALRAHGVPYELHLYAKGPHRLGLATGYGLHWTLDCIRWLRSYGF